MGLMEVTREFSIGFFSFSFYLVKVTKGKISKTSLCLPLFIMCWTCVSYHKDDNGSEVIGILNSVIGEI